jgi:DegV family protein with EDD domain
MAGDLSTLSPVIVTDSTCDLPAAVLAHYGIQVIPLKITFGQEEYLSGVTMTLDQFLARLAQGDAHPQTASPDVDTVKALYEQASPDRRPILSIHISEALSKVIRTAREAARLLPDRSITVWNSHMVSASLGLQVLTAARAAQVGLTAEQIIPLLEQTYQAGNLLFCMDDLSFLYKGERIGRVSYYVAQTLRLKPVVTVSKSADTLGTYISATEHPHSLTAAVDGLLREIARAVGAHTTLRALVLHADSSTAELAADLSQKLAERYQCVTLETFPCSPVLAAHVGPRALGVAYAAGDWTV